jgi:long-chain acyl-CoA synthetase
MYPRVHAKEQPDKPAIIMGRSGEMVTYAQLDARSSQLAHLWRSAGLRRGDHVAVMMENHPRYFEVVWAALRSGLYITPINSFLSPAEAAYILNDSGSRSLVTSSAKGDVVSQLTGENAVPAVETRLVIGGSLHGLTGYEEAIAQYPTDPIDDESTGAAMFYSSGTTGRPKGVEGPLPEGRPSDLDPLTRGFATTYGLNRDMVYLSPAPLYHAAPLVFCYAVHRWGGTTIVMEHFDAATALELIERHRVTHSQWVPTMFIRMLKLPAEERTRYDLSSHQLAVHAAAPCPVHVKAAMIDWWGPILFEYYAATEGVGSTFVTSEEWLKRPGTVGRCMTGTIHIVGPDEHELPTGEEGAIYFDGGVIRPFEYHNDPVKTAEARLGDWWTTGDVGYLDEEGYLFLTDRKANMIISGGVNIYPREIEDAMIQHPAVGDVAVFGIPNEDFGEEVKAVVEPVAGIEGSPELEQELIAFCRERIAHFKCPRSVDFEAQLPRLPTGKLYKRLLKDRYWPSRSA